MVTAYVMIMVSAGEHLSWMNTVKESVLKVPGVVEAHCVMGRYDIVAKVNVKTWGDLVDLVGDKLRSIPGVKSTETLVGYE